MPCNSLTNFEYEEAFAIPELIKFAGVLAIKPGKPGKRTID